MTARPRKAAAKARPRAAKRRATAPEALKGAGCVLGLDVSSQTVGWCVFQEAKLVAFGKWHPEGPDKHHGEKLASYGTWLGAMLEEWRPDQLVVEAPYSGRRRYTYGILMLYLGVALRTHFEHFGEELPEANRCRPDAVKRGMAARKGATYEDRKRQMVQQINKLYGLELKYKPKDKGRVSDDDIADAIALVHAWHTKES